MPPVPTRGGRQHHQRTEVHRLFTCSQQLERTGPSGEFVLANGGYGIWAAGPVGTTSGNQAAGNGASPRAWNAACLAPHLRTATEDDRPPRLNGRFRQPPTNRTGRGDTRTHDTGRRALGNLAGGRQATVHSRHPVSGQRDVGRTMTFEARVGERDAARIFRGRSSIPRPRLRTNSHRPTPARRRVWSADGSRAIGGGPSRN